MYRATLQLSNKTEIKCHLMMENSRCKCGTLCRHTSPRNCHDVSRHNGRTTEHCYSQIPEICSRQIFCWVDPLFTAFDWK